MKMSKIFHTQSSEGGKTKTRNENIQQKLWKNIFKFPSYLQFNLIHN